MSEPSDVERAKRIRDALGGPDMEWDSAILVTRPLRKADVEWLLSDHDRLTRELRAADAKIAKLTHALEQEQRTRAQAPIARRTDA